MRGKGLAFVAALGLAFSAAPAAQALPVLEEADAAELAQALADATEAQGGVCYGWAVQVADGSGGPSGLDVGSDKGPGVPVDRAICPKYVELQAGIEFTCESCESEDSSNLLIDANFAGAPTKDDLDDLGFSGGDLTRDDNDVVLTNMVGALPLVTASNGAAAPVPGPDEAEADKPAAGDVPTGTPSTPDWLREHWLALVFFGLLAGGGVAWLVRLRSADRLTGSDISTPGEQSDLSTPGEQVDRSPPGKKSGLILPGEQSDLSPPGEKSDLINPREQ